MQAMSQDLHMLISQIHENDVFAGIVFEPIGHNLRSIGRGNRGKKR